MEVAVTPPPAILPTTPVVDTARADRRRDWAVWMLFLGALAMTAYAALALYIGRNNANQTMWLGLAAHVNIFVVLTAIGGQIIKRNLEIDRTGIKLDDRDQQS